MNPRKDTLPFIKTNLHKYGIEWVNEGRVSDDFKFLIFGRPNQGKQIGLYDRESTVMRLEKYDQQIEGVELLPNCAKSHAAEASYSNFIKQRGVCVKVENLISLEKLLDWYFGV